MERVVNTWRWSGTSTCGDGRSCVACTEDSAAGMAACGGSTYSGLQADGQAWLGSSKGIMAYPCAWVVLANMRMGDRGTGMHLLGCCLSRAGVPGRCHVVES